MDSIRKKSNNSTEEFSVNSNQTTEISYINNDNAAKKMVKKQRHIANMICVICEGPATGHNFSQISCHSCKEFFRRNALLPQNKVKCMNKKHNLSNNRCQIRFDIDRKCQQCRLIKCLEAGMRKDLLLTSKDKLLKKQRIEENRQIYTIQNNHRISYLTDIDRSILIDIQNAYTSAIESSPLLSSIISFDCTPDKIFSLMNVTDIDSLAAIRVIYFLRTIEDFQLLNEQDRFTIVKYNIIPLLFIHDALNFDPVRELWSFDNATTPYSAFNEGFAHSCKSLFILCYGYDLTKDYISILHSLFNTIKKDPVIAQLLMLILIFSPGLLIDDTQMPLLIDNHYVIKTHLKYTDLLFRYLIDQFSLKIAVEKTTQFVEQTLTIQKFDRQFHEKFKNKVNINQINPLLGSVLRI